MNRVQSIDFVRAIAIVAVISIHTMPFNYGGDNIDINKYLFIGINQLARFAVPFFFIISGFFFASKVKANEVELLSLSAKMIKKLLLVWAFFSAIYIIPFSLIPTLTSSPSEFFAAINSNLNQITTKPIEFIFVGSKVHLWFLVSLSISIFITALFIKLYPKNPLLALIPISIGLYIFGLLAKAYSVTSWGLDINFNTRNGPFFSTIFFVLGYVLSYFQLSPKHIVHGVLVMLVGYLLHFGEVYYLYSTFDISPSKVDYVAGTLLIGLGSAIIALSNHKFLRNESLSYIGKHTLGIYTIHYIYVSIIDKLSYNFSSATWEISYIFIVLLLSLGTTMLLSKNKWLKKVLT